LKEPSAKLFTGADLDDAQKTTAALVLYVIKMEVDPRLVVLASEAGPNEIRLLKPDEARELRVAYEPFRYKPWHVEPYGGGAIALSETNDGVSRMIVSCSKRLGPNVTLVDSTTSWDIGAWFRQCSNGDRNGAHPVFGTRVGPSRVQVINRAYGGAMIRFQLPTYDPPLTSPELLSIENYSMACSTNRYLGTRENFVPAVRLALRNCYQD
jgi:hypothetical protein